VFVDVNSLATRLHERLSERSGEPISALIVDDVWTAVVEGTIATGERLPTSRQVAIALGVSPRAVERAYEELEERGVITTRPGEGTLVALRSPAEEERMRYRSLTDLCRETVARARALDFTVEDVLDQIAEFRPSGRLD
jgi:GntR family transcriptional regulator